MPNIVQGNSLPGTATNRQIVAYVQELEDQLRYVLANLGAENMAPDAIKVETLAPDVKKVFADSEQNMARISANAKRIEASVAGKYDKVASIGIDESGITMTGGAINMEADTEVNIKSSGRINIEAGGEGNISLTDGGGSVDAKNGTFTYLNVDGKTVGGDAFFMPVKALFTENAVQAPDAEKPYLWINSLTDGGGSSEEQITVAEPYWQNISHSYSGTFDVGTPSGQLSGDTFSYKLSLGLTHRNAERVNVQVVYVRLSNGTDNIVFTDTIGGNFKSGDIINFNAELTGESVNLFNGNQITARIQFSGDSALTLRLMTSTKVPFLLTGRGNGGGGGTGINDTEIKWVTE